ncbi:MAG: nucleotidyltransferase family protein [Rubrivivax sp.]|nr:nucleotidyltransferase family protein [Rubrivivax sp.]
MRLRPTIVIPAAGPGHRFGGTLHKLAQPFGGSTVLGSTVRHAIESQLPVVVVTTAALAPLVARQLATRDIVVLDAGEAADGMGRSISAGVAERSGAPGWLVLPGDMPLVRSGSILAVASALEQHPVAYAQHGGRRGHPVGFAAELYSELILLHGDDGARRVAARYPSHGVELDDPGVLLDVDTASDLEALRRAGGLPQPADS